MSVGFDGASFPFELKILEAKEESTMVLRTPSTSPSLAYEENEASHFDTIVVTSRLSGIVGFPSFERVGKAASGIDDVCILMLSSLWRMGGEEDAIISSFHRSPYNYPRADFFTYTG
jgi:hypothetical protein